MNNEEIKNPCCCSGERDYGCNTCEECPIKNKEVIKQYSLEWYKEMRKLNKDTIISLVESNGKQRDALKNQLLEKETKIVEMKAMLDEVYLATCDFNIDLFYPDKAERYNKISNEIWQFINREPISNNED